jgi:hypothetical protein
MKFEWGPEKEKRNPCGLFPQGRQQKTRRNSMLKDGEKHEKGI